MAHLRARHYKKLSSIREHTHGEGETVYTGGIEDDEEPDTPSGEDKSIHIQELEVKTMDYDANKVSDMMMLGGPE